MKMQQSSITLQAIRVFSICLLAISLTACGFKLRGSYDLAPELQRIYVAGSSSSAVVDDLKTFLSTSATVLDEKSDADAILTIVSENQKTTTLSTDSRGKVRESEMQLNIVYSLKRANGDVLIDKETISLIRDYINDENDIISRTNEAAVITRDLKRDAAQQIIRRLQAVRIQ